MKNVLWNCAEKNCAEHEKGNKKQLKIIKELYSLMMTLYKTDIFYALWMKGSLNLFVIPFEME